MVDTNVVIYAMRMHRKDDDDLLVEMTTDSVAALRSLDVLVVSAVTVTEIMRGMRPDELERNDIQAVLSSWTVLSLDAPAAAFAAELLSKRGEAEKTCRRCLIAAKDHKCPLCGNAVPASKRINDAMIVATAETNPAIKTLYAYDNGVLSFAQYVSNCAISRPPSTRGALWEWAKTQPLSNPAPASPPPTPSNQPGSSTGQPSRENQPAEPQAPQRSDASSPSSPPTMQTPASPSGDR